MSTLTDVAECELGQALRAIREAAESERSHTPVTDWPLGEYYLALARAQAERRTRAIRSPEQIQVLERARRNSVLAHRNRARQLIEAAERRVMRRTGDREVLR